MTNKQNSVSGVDPDAEPGAWGMSIYSGGSLFGDSETHVACYLGSEDR